MFREVLASIADLQKSRSSVEDYAKHMMSAKRHSTSAQAERGSCGVAASVPMGGAAMTNVVWLDNRVRIRDRSGG